MSYGSGSESSRAGCLFRSVAIGLAVCVMLFILTDRMLGKTLKETGYVIDKTTKTSTTHKNNRTKTKTTYYVKISIPSSGTDNQSVDKSDYGLLSIGDVVEITYTVGGISGSRYFKGIRKSSLLAEQYRKSEHR